MQKSNPKNRYFLNNPGRRMNPRLTGTLEIRA